MDLAEQLQRAHDAVWLLWWLLLLSIMIGWERTPKESENERRKIK